MDILNIALALFFFMVTYILFENCMKSGGAVSNNPGNSGNGDERFDENSPFGRNLGDVGANSDENYGESPIASKTPGDDELGRETIYTQDYYPWWRSTRWWNYDGWLYQKPYYNYWRRPQYYNYWYSGRPLIIGGKRYYKRNNW